jgi:UDP-N-acetylglucosamine--N-acetylmuramyl-(pentapeptide) pyrophosphoryl-undecaprenol N-acetylglucosamine transferase
MEAVGGATVLPQADLTGARLSEMISAILLNPQRLQTMCDKSWGMRRIDAGEVIVRECYALMGVTHDINGTVGAAGG